MEDNLKTIIGLEYLQIRISRDGTRVWINDTEKCLLRVARIKNIEIDDMRKIK